MSLNYSTNKMTKTKKHLVPGPFNLRSIYIRESHVTMATEFDPLLANQQLHAINKIESGKVQTREEVIEVDGVKKTFKSCTFVTVFQFCYIKIENGASQETISALNPDENFAAKIIAEIAVDYEVVDDEFPDKEKLTGWASSNSLMHCWPYWREFCHNTLLRMNLPVTIIPLLNMQPPEKK